MTMKPEDFDEFVKALHSVAIIKTGETLVCNIGSALTEREVAELNSSLEVASASLGIKILILPSYVKVARIDETDL